MAQGLEKLETKQETGSRGDQCTNSQCQRRIRQLEEELQRLKSVGYDMLKQRGGWQIVGKKPTDTSLEFNNLFDHEAEDLAKHLQRNAGKEEDTARQIVCKEFQSIYNYLKSSIFTQLVRTLSKVFMLSTDEDNGEQLYDICRAYGLLVSASGIAQETVNDKIAKEAAEAICKQQECSPLPLIESFTTKSAQLSWDLLTTTPPLLSLTPPSHYFKQWHEKELAPTWSKELTSYELVYYRPILFTSCEGRAIRKGWVGNRKITTVGSQPKFKEDCGRDTTGLTHAHCEWSEIPTSNCKDSICEHCRLPLQCGCDRWLNCGGDSVVLDQYKPHQLIPSFKYREGRMQETDGAHMHYTSVLSKGQPEPVDDGLENQVTTKYFVQGTMPLKRNTSPAHKSMAQAPNIGVKPRLL